MTNPQNRISYGQLCVSKSLDGFASGAFRTSASRPQPVNFGAATPPATPEPVTIASQMRLRDLPSLLTLFALPSETESVTLEKRKSKFLPDYEHLLSRNPILPTNTERFLPRLTEYTGLLLISLFVGCSKENHVNSLSTPPASLAALFGFGRFCGLLNFQDQPSLQTSGDRANARC